VAASVVILALCAVSCSASNGAESGARSLTVLAAASLTESFTRIAEDFEVHNHGVRVDLSFGPSDGLAAQIREGAPADVFASASPAWVDDVATNGPGVTDRAVFARTSLVVIVPADDPADIDSIEDLSGPEVKLVVAAPGVPAGDYAREALNRAGIADRVEPNIVSNEEDVKAVLQKVVLGEADAGMVYRTEVTSDVRSKLEVIEIPEEVNVVAIFPIAIVRGTAAPALAREFVAFVLGPGQATLRSLGFLPP
jgi:molybdate transport system substrate-binding protein